MSSGDSDASYIPDEELYEMLEADVRKKAEEEQGVENKCHQSPEKNVSEQMDADAPETMEEGMLWNDGYQYCNV